MPNKDSEFTYTQPYIVVGGLVVRDNKVLILKENHFPDKGKWNIPAGKLDYGESPLDAVVREVYEETGLDFKPESIVGINSVHRMDVPNESGTTHVLRIVYAGTAEGDPTNDHGDIEDGEPEISEYRWIEFSDLQNMDTKILRYHDTKTYVKNYVDGISYPIETIQHIVQTLP